MILRRLLRPTRPAPSAPNVLSAALSTRTVGARWLPSHPAARRARPLHPLRLGAGRRPGRGFARAAAAAAEDDEQPLPSRKLTLGDVELRYTRSSGAPSERFTSVCNSVQERGRVARPVLVAWGSLARRASCGSCAHSDGP